jgi:two-component system, NtrC family, sensor kinase
VLNMSLAFLRLRLEAVPADSAGVWLDELLDIVGGASETTCHLIDLSRQLGGRGSGAVETLSIAEVVSQVLRMFEPQLGPRSELVEEMQSDAVVMADPTRLRQVLLNLLSNAAHAVADAGEDGRITVRVALAGEHAIAITVHDTGAGLSPEARLRAFEPQFTTRPGVGSGIGLALSRRFVEAWGGTLSLEDGPGRGTVAHIVLPCLRRTE